MKFFQKFHLVGVSFSIIVLSQSLAFSAEPIQVYVLDPAISKEDAAKSFSNPRIQVIDATHSTPTKTSTLFEKSGLSTYTNHFDPYAKKMLSLRAQTLSLAKLQHHYPDLPKSGLKRLIELSHEK